MLDAGVNVLRALRIASQHTGNGRLIETANEIARHLGDGRELHQALARYPDLFDPFYIEMTRQGEADGVLGKALLSVADYLDHATGAPLPALEVGTPTVPTVSYGAGVGVVTTTMITLGVLALGAAVIWGLAVARPEILPSQWLTPIGLFWAGVCLLAGALLLQRLRRPLAAAVVAPLVRPISAKTASRRSAETSAVVREALDEQNEEAAVPPAPFNGLSPFDVEETTPEDTIDKRFKL